MKIPARVTGESLAARGDSRRDLIITGWGDPGSVRTKEWNYIGRGTARNNHYDLAVAYLF